MKNLIHLAFALCLAACVSQPVTTTLSGLHANNGAAVAIELNRRYNLTYPNCWSSETAPAFLCSGVIIRATTYGDTWNVWDPSPLAVSVGGVSFSYMRNDARFPNIFPGTNNGYIVMPASATPGGYMLFNYLCFFPIDGASNNRSANGCGEHRLWGAISGYCSSQGVTTAEQFYANYLSHGQPYHQKQCSFDVHDNSPYQTARLFREGVRATPMLPPNNGYDENELIARVWTIQPASAMPIEAFFYLRGSADGLSQAKKNQQSYYGKTNGRIVPIISLSIAPTGYAATFQYSAADQMYQ
ncbi:hypothetical protein [Pseudomonas sp.]|uniref:hypothetical protein n=1 Tax=Pseudomonas sp. TaxID=306 RepID=UPI003CC5E672